MPHQVRARERAVIEILFSVQTDTLFSLFNLNKAATETMASETTQKIKSYLTDTAWPGVKQGSRELVKEVSSEIKQELKSSFVPAKDSLEKTVVQITKKTGIALAGVALITAGSQIIRQALVNPIEKCARNFKRANLHKCALLAVGGGMILTGAGALIFCDSIADYASSLVK